MEYSDMALFATIAMPEWDFIEDNRDKSKQLVYDMLDELCSHSDTLEVDFLEHGIVKLHIELLDNTGREQVQGLWQNPRRLPYCEVMKFSCRIPFNFSIQSNPPSQESDLRGMNKNVISLIFPKRMCDIFICSNLSRVGSIQWGENLLFQDSKMLNYHHMPHSSTMFLYEAVQVVNKIKWPKLYTIDFPKVWKWANKNEGFVTSFGGGATGRALNAFSRMFASEDYDQALQLMWSLLGIEALYGKGRIPVLEQIREKTYALLGEQEEFKKVINKMYDFRSRFLHGDLDFPGLAFMFDAMDSYEKYLKEQNETVGLATAILIATLQEMILRDWASIDFTYSVSGLNH